MLFCIPLIARYAVVVARDVEHGKHLAALCAATGQQRAELHGACAEDAGEFVEKAAANGPVGLRLRLFIGVYSKAERIQQVEKDVYAASYGAVVERPHICGHFGGESHPFVLGGFGHFVAERIHYNRGMVVILLHHCKQVLRPVAHYAVGVVELGFADIPHVAVLIDHKHAQAVAGGYKGL